MARLAEKTTVPTTTHVYLRPLIVLIVAFLVLLGVVIVGKIKTPSLSVDSYSYTSGSINYHFTYPKLFSKRIVSNISTRTVEQCYYDKSNSIVGCISVFYTPYDLNLNANAARVDYAAVGNQNEAAIPQFSGLEVNQADCTRHQFITTKSNKPVLECDIAAWRTKTVASGGKALTGKTIFGTSKRGLYTFSYVARSDFWNAHTDDWKPMFEAVDFSTN